MDLAQLEAQFWGAVCAPRPPSALEATFVGRGGLSAAQRMEIYWRGYRIRRQRVLADTFPRLRALLGDERFLALVLGYLSGHASDQPAIEWFGRDLPAAMARQPEHPAYLSDLARLEWARLEVLLVPDAPDIVSIDMLPGIDFAAARAQLSPAARLLRLHPRALSAFDRAVPAEAPAEEQERVGCLVWRRVHRAAHRPLSAREFDALALLARGASFAAICAAFDGPEAAQAAATTIGRWIRNGLLCALRT